MASSTLQVLIDIKSKLAGLEASVLQMRQLKNETAAVSSAGSALSGVFAGIAAGATIQLTQQLSRIPQILTQSISDGVNFNATIESSRIGIASIIKAFDATGKFQNFDAALAESGRAVDFLKRKAIETQATFDELLVGYQAAAGPAFAAGINSTRDQIKLTVALSQAMSALTIPAREMSQEIRGVFEGDTSRQSRLNQVLRITKAEIDQAALSGTAYQLVMGRLKTFTEGAERGQKTYNVAMSNFADVLTQLKGTGTIELFELLKKKILEINAELNKDQTREAVRAWGASLAEFAEKLAARLSQMNAGTRTELEALKKAYDFAANLTVGDVVLGRGPIIPERGVSAGDRAALQQFVEDARRRRESLLEEIRDSELLGDRKKSLALIQAEITKLAERTKDENKGIAGVVSTLIPDTAQLATNLDAIKEAAKGTAAAMKLTKKQIEGMVETSGKLQALNLETARIAAKAGDAATVSRIIRESVQPSIQITSTGATEKRIELSEFEIELMQKRIALEKQFGALGQNQIESSTNADVRIEALREIHAREEAIKNAVKGTAAEHKDITTLLRSQETTIAGIRQQQELIAQNPYLTINEKNAQLLALMQQEIATLNSEVAKGQALLAGGTLDPQTYEQVRQKVQEARFEIELLSQKTSTLNFSGGLQENLLSWVNSMGTAAQQVGRAITGSIGTAIDATADALTGLIFQTRDWRQTVLSAAQSIVSSLIKIGLQMIAQKVLGSLLTRTTAQEQTAAGTQVAASWAPAAAATSVGSFGSSAVVGAIAAAAAIAAIIALLVGFETGGPTFGRQGRIAGVVHGEEYVHPKTTVDYYGLQTMAAIHRRRIPAAQLQALVGNYRYQVTPRLGSFEMGGAVAAIESSAASNESSRAGGETRLSNYLVLDPAKLRKMILEDGADEIWVTDIKSGRSYRVRGNRA